MFSVVTDRGGSGGGGGDACPPAARWHTATFLAENASARRWLP